MNEGVTDHVDTLAMFFYTCTALNSNAMKNLALIVCLLCSSCYQSAMSPLTNANGTPVVIEVGGVKSASQLKKSTQMAVLETLSQKSNSPDKIQRYFPGQDVNKIQAECIVGFIYGNCRLKSGKEFVGLTPAVGIRAKAPQDQVEQAARAAAVDVYQLARSNYSIHSMNDLKKWQKTSE